MVFKYETLGIPQEDREKLRSEVLTLRNPLGSSFLELYGPQNKRPFQYLFDGHSEYLYERFGERPSIIVGRKGSGKTTYLNNIQFKDNVIGIPIITWNIIDEVTEIIGKMLDNGIDVRAEKASYIWQWLFLNAIIITTINKKIVDNESLKKVIAPSLFASYAQMGASAITSFFKDKINDWFESGKNAELASAGFIIEDKSSAIDTLERKISKHLANIKKVAVILLDNEESYLEESKAAINTKTIRRSKAVAISGLLNYCGRANEGAVNVQIRYCIPAEQFHAFSELSETSGKDFSNIHLLHWSSGELLSMIAHRFLLYLYVWREKSPILNDVYDELVGHDIYQRQGALDFFHRILPAEIKNCREIPEKTVTYILRHFQILPRQLITVFNSIVSNTIANGNLLSINENTVLNAVHEQEASMAGEIIKAYKLVYPEASQIVKKVLPNMPLIFSYKDLRYFYDGTKFTNNGKKILASFQNKKKVEISPDRFERCLIETGVVGRLLSRPSNSKVGYINAEFEYSMPSTLDLCEDDILVIHPIFSAQRLASAKEQFGKNLIGIYPHDADPESEQNRELIKKTKFII